MNTRRSVKINAIPDRDLPTTASSISFEIRNPTRSASAGYLRPRSASIATASPTLGRKISKKGGKAVSRAKPTTRLASNQDDVAQQSEGSNDHMDTDSMEQTSTPREDVNQNVSDIPAVDTSEDASRNESNLSDNSAETVDIGRQTKRKTTTTKQDVMKHFTKQPDGTFKCNICNKDKVSVSFSQ